MDYNKLFTKIMYNAKNPMEGAVNIFNEVANRRYLEYEVLHDNGNENYIDSEDSWNPKTVSDIIKELKYWYSLYFEEGHIRHDEEYSDRHLFKKAIDFLEPYA